MLRKVALTAGFLGVFVAGSSTYAAPSYLGITPRGNPQAVASIIHGTCAACHGADGNSIGSSFPNLAGQNYNYLLKELENFRSGVRSTEPMSAVIKTVPVAKGDRNIRDLATFFSEQKLKRSGAAAKITPAIAKLGYRIFAGGIRSEKVPACAACHGSSAGGMAPMAVPALAGQREPYVLRELKHFADGKRHNSPHHVMATIAKRLTKVQMMAVADYVSMMRPSLMLASGPKSYRAYVKTMRKLAVPGIPKDDLVAASAAK
jgi:cytochrome c553